MTIPSIPDRRYRFLPADDPLNGAQGATSQGKISPASMYGDSTDRALRRLIEHAELLGKKANMALKFGASLLALGAIVFVLTYAIVSMPSKRIEYPLVFQEALNVYGSRSFTEDVIRAAENKDFYKLQGLLKTRPMHAEQDTPDARNRADFKLEGQELVLAQVALHIPEVRKSFDFKGALAAQNGKTPIAPAQLSALEIAAYGEPKSKEALTYIGETLSTRRWFHGLGFGLGAVGGLLIALGACFQFVVFFINRRLDRIETLLLKKTRVR